MLRKIVDTQLAIFSLSKECVGRIAAEDAGVRILLADAEFFLPKETIRSTSVNRVGRVQMGSYVFQLRLFPEAAKELKNKLAGFGVKLKRGEVPALEVVAVTPTTVEFYLDPVDIFGHDQRGTSPVKAFGDAIREKYGLVE